jgi:hypothetical protein
MATALDFAVDSEVVSKFNKDRKGRVLSNKTQRGPAFVAVEWSNGQLASVRVADLVSANAVEAEFQAFRDSVNAKINSAVTLLREAASLAEDRGLSLASRDDNFDYIFLRDDLVRVVEDYADGGWSRSNC